MSNITNRGHTIVIGAGVAGLAASRMLSGPYGKVTILEARNRIGGRINTVRPPGWHVPVEGGAEFIHGEPSAIWEGVRVAGLAAYEVSERRWHLTEQGLRLS